MIGNVKFITSLFSNNFVFYSPVMEQGMKDSASRVGAAENNKSLVKTSHLNVVLYFV